jgi:hypothetical protein
MVANERMTVSTVNREVITSPSEVNSMDIRTVTTYQADYAVVTDSRGSVLSTTEFGFTSEELERAIAGQEPQIP